MRPITASSQPPLAGKPPFRHCTAVAPFPPKPPLTLSIRPRSSPRRPPRRQSRHRDHRPAGNYTGQRIRYPTRRSVKFHRQRPPTRWPVGSFLGGFRRPALRTRGNIYDGPSSETLHHSGRSLARYRTVARCLLAMAAHASREPHNCSRRRLGAISETILERPFDFYLHTKV